MASSLLPDRPFIIKICGITRLSDGLVALEAGADWLGFIRWPRSARFREAAEQANLLAQLRSQAGRPFEAVGVFVNASAEDIDRDARQIGLDRIQLHGAESPEFTRSLGRPVLKALRIRDQASVVEADRFDGLDLLVDAWDDTLPGGTGRTCDPTLIEPLVRRRPVIVAGGLNPDNIAGVVESLRPWGVDVSSGVEQSPGIKDPDKVRRLIQLARQAFRRSL